MYSCFGHGQFLPPGCLYAGVFFQSNSGYSFSKSSIATIMIYVHIKLDQGWFMVINPNVHKLQIPHPD